MSFDEENEDAIVFRARRVVKRNLRVTVDAPVFGDWVKPGRARVGSARSQRLVPAKGQRWEVELLGEDQAPLEGLAGTLPPCELLVLDVTRAGDECDVLLCALERIDHEIARTHAIRLHAIEWPPGALRPRCRVISEDELRNGAKTAAELEAERDASPQADLKVWARERGIGGRR